MDTLIIKINNAKALNMLQALEELQFIEVIKKTPSALKKKKLSERMAGSISAEQAKIMNEELAKMRSEWNRDI